MDKNKNDVIRIERSIYVNNLSEGKQEDIVGTFVYQGDDYKEKGFIPYYILMDMNKKSLDIVFLNVEGVDDIETLTPEERRSRMVRQSGVLKNSETSEEVMKMMFKNSEEISALRSIEEPKCMICWMGNDGAAVSGGGVVDFKFI